MKRIRKKLKEKLDTFIIQHTTPFRAVKYFHPNGKSMTNGCYYQRGSFLNECRINKDCFVLDEDVHGEKNGMNNLRGGLVVFSTDVNVIYMNDDQLIDIIKQLVVRFNDSINRNENKSIYLLMRKTTKQQEKIEAFSIGCHFKGKYVGDKGEKYNDKSLSVEVNGISCRNLLSFAEMVAQEFMQETVLVKDLNLNEIFLANNIKKSSESTEEN